MSRIDELERRIAELEKHLGLDGIRPQPAVPYVPSWNPRDSFTVRTDCGCPANNVCMSVACPRSPQIVYGPSTTAARAFT